MNGLPWSDILSLFLIPPGLIILVGIFGFVMHVKWSWAGAAILGLSISGLIALALPMTGHQLMVPLESYASPIDPSIKQADKNVGAIVVLGAGRYADAPEYGGDTVGPTDLVRLRYAAWLQRRTGLPILVSGGSPFSNAIPEASLMEKSLTEDFHAHVKWVEGKSRTTWENARYSRDILTAAGIRNVYLVTSAWHMRRATWSFETNGVELPQAPTGFVTLGQKYTGILGFLPSAEGMEITSTALRERLGFVWYNFVHGSPPAPTVADKVPVPAH